MQEIDVKNNYNGNIKDNKDDTPVREVILSSWQRCRQYGVDPTKGVGEKISPEAMSMRLIANAELLSVARPIMENIYKTVKGSGFSIILTDKDGCLLDIIGDESTMEKANELNFTKGALWTEEAVGTNAIGTSLYLNEPIQTIGPEHYCVKHHDWTCSAAPIHDEDGHIIGCLDMSGKSSKAHLHTLGMVMTAADSIKKQLALIRSNKLIHATFQSISDGMIILDKYLKIKRANDMACRILKISKEDILTMNIKSFIKHTDFIDKILDTGRSHHNLECDFYTKDRGKIKCSMNAVPIMIDKKNIGIVITFKSSSYIYKVANKVAGYNAVYRFQDIITQNFQMNKIIDDAKKAALSDANVLIQGESGTGKELFAQSIHNYSKRENEPFVAVNCASIPKELMESEFFGYERGAFTGASKEGHVGKFELADGGTLFLDEIGELPLDMQSKLLRVLDNQRISRIGSHEEKKLNIRVIAATNRDLVEEITKKNFREDLYYRLNVMHIKLIPLRERPEDIQLLAQHFIARLNHRQGKDKKFSAGYIQKLKIQNWPGNVRELQNAVERSYFLCEEEYLTEAYLFDNILSNQRDFKSHEKIIPMEEIEAQNIHTALKQCNGSVVKACKILGMSRATIYRKMKRYKIIP